MAGGGSELSGGGGGGGAGGAGAGAVASAVGGGGASSSGGGQATAGTGPCPANALLCSDFEDDAIPPELVFFPEYLRATQTFVTLDQAVSHRGTRSLKVTGTNFSQMLGATVPSSFWGRVYLRSDSDIQQGHNTYVAAGTGSGDPNEGTYLRIGEHQCQLELNRNTDDKELLSNGGTYSCEGGVKLLKDTWYCLEFQFDGPGQQTRVFVDGAEVTALHTTDWGSYEFRVLKLGFEKYHGAEKTLWYDDLALSTTQLHCL